MNGVLSCMGKRYACLLCLILIAVFGRSQTVDTFYMSGQTVISSSQVLCIGDTLIFELKLDSLSDYSLIDSVAWTVQAPAGFWEIDDYHIGMVVTDTGFQLVQMICAQMWFHSNLTVHIYHNPPGTSNTWFMMCLADAGYIGLLCEPEIVALKPDTICEGNCMQPSAQITGGYINHQWSFPGGTPSHYTGAQPGPVCYSSPGVYPVSLVVTNDAGSDTVVSTVTVNPLPVFSLGVDTLLCDQGFYDLSPGITGGVYFWQDGSVQPFFRAMQDGLYRALVVKDGCVWTDSIELKFKNSPQIFLPDDTVMCENEPIRLYVQVEPYTMISWSTGDSMASVEISAPGNYTVSASNPCGADQQSVNVMTEDCRCYFYLPDAFTPGGNMLNEVFKPGFDCRMLEYRMQVFNRWGEMIFITDDPLQGWDGTHRQEKCEQGVYTALVEYSAKDGLLEKQNKVITLVMLIR